MCHSSHCNACFSMHHFAAGLSCGDAESPHSMVRTICTNSVGYLSAWASLRKRVASFSHLKGRHDKRDGRHGSKRDMANMTGDMGARATRRARWRHTGRTRCTFRLFHWVFQKCSTYNSPNWLLRVHNWLTMVEIFFTSVINLLTEGFEHLPPCTTHDRHASQILGISGHPTHIDRRPVHTEHFTNLFAARVHCPFVVHLV